MALFSFKDWLLGNAGVSGEYIYTTIHFVTFGVLILIAGVLIYLASTKRISNKAKRRIIVGVAIFQLSFELLWRIIYSIYHIQSPKYLYPLYPCNLSGIIIPLICIFNWKRGKDIFYLFGFVTGFLTFAYPEGIFTSNVLTFPILKSVLQHSGILFIPLFEFFAKSHKVTLKNFKWVLIGTFIHTFNSERIAKSMGMFEDFIYFESGLPFVIPGIPTRFPIIVTAFVVLGLLSYLGDIKYGNYLIRKALGIKQKSIEYKK